EDADELIALAMNDQRLLGRAHQYFDAALLRPRLQRIDHLMDDWQKLDRSIGIDVLAQLDAGKRQQVIDQARHSLSLRMHDGEEPLAGARVILRRPSQGLDEAR